MVNSPGHQMDFDNIKIIDQTSNHMKLKINELLHIIQREKKLNKKLHGVATYPHNIPLLYEFDFVKLLF